MKKDKLYLKKNCHHLLSIIGIIVILFSINKTMSEYNTSANIVSTINATPILSIEAYETNEINDFRNYGWAAYRFDIINGKLGKDGEFYVNEVDMEYYINVKKDSGDLSLKLQALYTLDESGNLKNEIPYVEGKGYGPFNLPYKKDDEVILNSDGIYESKYVSREKYQFVYIYDTCSVGVQNCVVNAEEAGKTYKFHIEVKAYQKVNN